MIAVRDLDSWAINDFEYALHLYTRNYLTILNEKKCPKALQLSSLKNK